MWFDESTFYQIYPLGFCGAEGENDGGEVRHRLSLIEEEIPRLAEMGVGALLLNPLFESERHGYDTVDPFHVDRRLGTNEDLVSLVKTCHQHGIRVVLDGVFHHVGRKFPPFEDVRMKREASPYCPWFFLDFHGNTRYCDGFWYADWEGHPELVKLRLEEKAVQDYFMRALLFWIDTFDIDGLRLDVCYSLPTWFLQLLRRTASERKGDFFLVGEVIHCTNYAQNIAPDKLDSITNYECYKGLVSAFNSSNLFEIEHSLTRLFGSFPWSLYTGKRMLSFVDNHDVSRAATALKEKRDLCNLYTVLFTMPGMPCIYYGSEYAAEGDKVASDAALRPAMASIRRDACPTLTRHIAFLAAIRRESRALQYGTYEKGTLSNTYFSFIRTTDGERVTTAVNIGENAVSIPVDAGVDLLTKMQHGGGNLQLLPFSSVIVRH